MAWYTSTCSCPISYTFDSNMMCCDVTQQSANTDRLCRFKLAERKSAQVQSIAGLAVHHNLPKRLDSELSCETWHYWHGLQLYVEDLRDDKQTRLFFTGERDISCVHSSSDGRILTVGHAPGMVSILHKLPSVMHMDFQSTLVDIRTQAAQNQHHVQFEAFKFWCDGVHGGLLTERCRLAHQPSSSEF